MAAPNVAVGQLLKLSFANIINGQIGLGTCDFRVSVIGGGSLTLLSLLTQWKLIVNAAWPAVTPAQVLLSGCLAELSSPVSGAVVQSATLADNVALGAVAGGTSPTQVAVVMRKNTGFAGRAMRGRLYWPFVPQASLTLPGELLPAAALGFNVAAALIFGNQTFAVGPNSVQVVAVLRHGGAPPTTTDLVSILATGRLGTQRRRGDYGQPNLPIA